jgi:hypothetical protein
MLEGRGRELTKVSITSDIFDCNTPKDRIQRSNCSFNTSFKRDISTLEEYRNGEGVSTVGIKDENGRDGEDEYRGNQG